ncbi:MAG: hypothetical protein ACK52I_31325 [Pseudomonadota bacterium]
MRRTLRLASTVTESRSAPRRPRHASAAPHRLASARRGTLRAAPSAQAVAAFRLRAGTGVPGRGRRPATLH